MNHHQDQTPPEKHKQTDTDHLSRRQMLRWASLAGTALAFGTGQTNEVLSDEITQDAARVDEDEGSPGELRVGFSQLDITPPIGAIMTGAGLPRSTGTDDPLAARTLVVQSGDQTVAIVGVDLVKIRRDLADNAIALASQRTGIDCRAVMICPSHNHSSPFVPMGGPNNKSKRMGNRRSVCSLRARPATSIPRRTHRPIGERKRAFLRERQ